MDTIFAPVNIQFFRDASNIYDTKGLTPATAGSAGIDLRACLADGPVHIQPGKRVKIAVGIAIEPLATGIAGFVYSRSGLGGITGIVVAQGVGVIDPDYRGEISVPLLNTGQEEYTVNHGDRIAQIIFQPFFQPHFTIVENLSSTKRGLGGFGHTGHK